MDATRYLRVSGAKMRVSEILIASAVATSKEDAARLITGSGQGVRINGERLLEDKEVGPCSISLGWQTIKVMNQ